LQEHIQMNHFTTPHKEYAEDVFQFLRNRELSYDLIILDPPAFAKSKKDIMTACRGYKDIMRLALEKMPGKSYLLTCSCSYHIEESLFRKLLFQASLEAKRDVRILQHHRHAFDHVESVYFPESSYL